MFKKILLSVLAAAAMAACSKEEIKNVNSNPEGIDCITVSPVVPKATRGTNTTISALQGDANGFYVVAYGNNAFYFNRTKAIYSASGQEGIADQPGFFLEKNYAWPSYDLTFAAWYPTVLPAGGGSVEGAYKSDGTTKMEGQYVSQPQWDGEGNLTKGQYIKGFVPSTDCTKQTDIVMARTKAAAADHKENNSAVVLNFRHILSKISIKAAKSEGDQIKVEIAEVELRNIPSKANFDFRGNDDYVTDNRYGNAGVEQSALVPFNHWTLDVPTSITTYSDASIDLANMQRYPCKLATPVTVGPEVSGTAQNLLTDDTSMLLIPVDFNGNYCGYLKAWNQTITEPDKVGIGAYLALTMRVLKKSATDPDGFDVIYPANDTPADLRKSVDGVEYGKAAAGIITSSTKWEPGRHYVYTLNFTDSGVGDTDPENPGGGEDILGENMWFTVTVDDWAEVPSTPSF